MMNVISLTRAGESKIKGSVKNKSNPDESILHYQGWMQILLRRNENYDDQYFSFNT